MRLFVFVSPPALVMECRHSRSSDRNSGLLQKAVTPASFASSSISSQLYQYDDRHISASLLLDAACDLDAVHVGKQPVDYVDGVEVFAGDCLVGAEYGFFS